MPQPTKYWLRFEATARDASGVEKPFLLEITEPVDKEWHSELRMHCPLLSRRSMPSAGVDGEQAKELALWLVADQLHHHGYQLFDKRGNAIDPPRYKGPPARVRYGHE